MAILVAALLAISFVPFASHTARAAEGDPVVTLEDGVNGCNGVVTTPGSENTDKRLVSGDLEPGGTVTFEISYPVDPADVAGRETFVITDCVFIDGEAALKYSVSFVPNTENYVLTFDLVIPEDAPIGAEYCNYAKTTAAPSTSQASNRKAGPACFLIGGDVRVLKVDQDGNPLAGAEFTVECTRPDSTAEAPEVIISGLVDENGDPAEATVAGLTTTVTGFTDADGAIAIAGPAGTECTVTEVNPPAGYQPPADDSIDLTIPVGGSEQVEYTFVNIGTGALKITKIADAAGTFSFDVDCTDNAFDKSNIIINVGAGQTGSPGVSAPVIEGIPIGVTCTVTEDSNPQFSTTVTPAGGVVVIDGGTENVTFTNTRLKGALKITKIANAEGSFSFDVDCTDNAFDKSNIIITIGAGQTGTPGVSAPLIEGIPTGVTCTVTEDSNPDFSYTVTPANGEITIGTGTNTVTFTNTRNTGGLTISKTTVGGAGTFVFDVDCTGTAYDRTGENPVTIVVGADATNTAVLSGIPTGTECTVTERSNPGFTETLVVPEDGTVTIDGNGETVSFTNTAKGALTISKKAVGGAGTFVFDVDCDGTAYDRTGENPVTIQVGAGATQTEVLSGIPSGTVCTVTERSHPDFTVTAQVPENGTVTIDPNGETVSFENTRNTGALTVSKTALGGAGTFVFDVDCTGTAYDHTGANAVTIQVAAGATQTTVLSGIPTGTVCTVTERSNPAFAQTAVVPGNGTVTIDGNGETVSFTNTLLTGALNVTKAVSPVAGGGTVIEFGDTLTYTLTVSATGTLTQSNVVVKDYIPGYDPARPKSGNTTYVAGSATCVGGGTCNVSYSAATHQITWGLGDMAPGTTRQVTFKVTIDSVAGDPGETVAVDVLNAGTVQSTQTPVKPSNEVKTTVTEVFPVKNVKPPKVLPHTGAGVEPGLLAAGAVSLLSLGLLLMAASRRRQGGAHRA